MWIYVDGRTLVETITGRDALHLGSNISMPQLGSVRVYQH